MKKQIPIVAYFALSLCAILNAETLVTLRVDALLGAAQAHLAYACYSACVAAGVLFFFVFQKILREGKLLRATMYAIYPLAMLASFLLERSGGSGQLYARMMALFLLAGVNTGLVSLLLYGVYREAPACVGRVLAVASGLGIGAHYLLVAFSGARIAPNLQAALLIAIAGMLALAPRVLRRLPAMPPGDAAGQGAVAPQYPAQDAAGEALQGQACRQLLVTNAVIIAGLSFLIGVSDALASQEIAHFITGETVVYPMLFYIPGQVLAGLLLDIRRGRYLHLATLICVVALIPITLFLETPEEFYLNAGLNYFVGGFFLVYIMTSIISIADKAKNRLAVICLPGVIYPLCCGVGGLLSPPISREMPIYMVLAGYSALIACLMLAIFLLERFLRGLEPSLTPPAQAAHGAALEGAPRMLPVLPLKKHSADMSMIARQYGLTGREREVLPFLLSAMTADEIAAELHISVNTLKTHIRNILGKANAASRRELRQRLL